MNRLKLKTYLELATNAAVIIVAVVVVAAFSRDLFKQERVQLRTGLEKGSRLELTALKIKTGQPQTLIVAMNTRCEYCSQSIPFLNELEEAQKSMGHHNNILAVFPD